MSHKKTALTEPTGDLVIRTIAMPADANRYGDIFGGWVVSQMDLGGAVLAHQCSHHRMTTIAIDGMVFIRPIMIGDVVSCYATIVKKGNTSVGIKVEIWVDRLKETASQKVTEGLFTYVSIDEKGKPQPIQWHS